MTRTLTTAFVAFVVLASASAVRADGYEDHAADAMRSYGPVVHQPAPLTTKNVGLQKGGQISSSWMDRASQTTDGGY